MERPKITRFISSCNLTHWSIVSIIHPAIWPIRLISTILILSFLPSFSDYFVRPLYAYPPLYTMYLVNFTATTATNTPNTLQYNTLSGGSLFLSFSIHFFVKIMLILQNIAQNSSKTTCSHPRMIWSSRFWIIKMPRRITAAGQRVLLLYED